MGQAFEEEKVILSLISATDSFRVAAMRLIQFHPQGAAISSAKQLFLQGGYFRRGQLFPQGGYFRRAVQGRSARGRLRVLSCSCGLEGFRVAAA